MSASYKNNEQRRPRHTDGPVAAAGSISGQMTHLENGYVRPLQGKPGANRCD